MRGATGRGGARPLIGLAAIALAGCLTSAKEPADDFVPVDDVPPEEALDEAYFILQYEDLASVDWPAAYARYSIFVCNPSFSSSPEFLDAARAGLPDAKFLAYTSAQDVPITRYVGNPYYDALRAAFSEDYCIRDLDTGEIVEIYGHGTPNSVPSWIPRPASVDALVAFHENVTMQVPWDGFYIDQCNALYPNHRMLTLNSITDDFDMDGDGVEDSMAILVLRYGQGRPYLTARMREAFPDKILVANSGGGLGDPALNGITLEGVGDRFTVLQARDFLTAQRSVAVAPFHAVLWNTTQESELPSRELAEELDGVYFGHVVGAYEAARTLRTPTLRRQVVPPDRLEDSADRAPERTADR